MNPPPPPPAAVDADIHVSRDGVILGIWKASQIRSMFVSGDFKHSDYYWAEEVGEWIRFVPETPSAQGYPYLGDNLFYYIKDDYVYGPRSLGEINALMQSDWIDEATLATFFPSEAWLPLSEILEGQPNNWVATGLRACVGDPTAVAQLASQVFNGAVAWLEKPAPEKQDKQIQ